MKKRLFRPNKFLQFILLSADFFADYENKICLFLLTCLLTGAIHPHSSGTFHADQFESISGLSGDFNNRRINCMKTASKIENKSDQLPAPQPIARAEKKSMLEAHVPKIPVIPLDISRWIASRLRPIESALHE